ncbi:MAG TPA: DUF167 domain-containing protein [Gaiellaceae bacterium]|nr:DUF167 domain-containing protein [Gaiellaceae bacterium]
MAGRATRLRLRVVPGSKSAGIIGRRGDAWKLRVSAAPERGRANDAALRLLAETLRVQPADVRLVSGHSSRDKIVEVTGIAPSEAERRLGA